MIRRSYLLRLRFLWIFGLCQEIKIYHVFGAQSYFIGADICYWPEWGNVASTITSGRTSEKRLRKEMRFQKVQELRLLQEQRTAPEKYVVHFQGPCMINIWTLEYHSMMLQLSVATLNLILFYVMVA